MLHSCARTTEERRVELIDAAVAFDELVFRPRSWFLIDGSNRRVPGIFAPDVKSALDLLERSAGTAVVGTLRPEIRALDIDCSGKFFDLGVFARDAVVQWCRARRLWHLVRESGRGPGHWHVLVAPGVHEDDLVEYVASLRRELHLSGKHLDLREAGGLRALSSPHRSGAPALVPEGLGDALTALREILASPSAAPLGLRRQRRPRCHTSRVVPLVPLPRKGRDLVPGWQEYLDTGRAPAAHSDRSGLELEATFQLVIAGHSAETAWAAIDDSHESAFTKSKDRGRGWWWHLWNAAVRSADDWRLEHLLSNTTPRPQEDGQTPAWGDDATPEQQEARTRLHTAWSRVCDLWITWSASTRHTDLEIAATVFERLIRVGSTSTQLPERDLVLDSAVRSRSTVRASLKRLIDAGVLARHQTYVEGTTDTAHTIEVLSGTDADTREGRAIGPTCVSHPLAARPRLELRRALPGPTLALAWVLGSGGTHSEEKLASLAGLLPHPEGEMSLWSRRALRSRLRTLAEHGLARQSEDGLWAGGSGAGPELMQHGAQIQAEVRASVSAERLDFRSAIDPDLRQARWEAQRAAAIAQSRKADLVRQRAWLDSLPAHERQRRQELGRRRFAALSTDDQARFKRQRATWRRSAGANERQRYEAWKAGLNEGEYARRSAERSHAFNQLPEPLKGQVVRDWAMHRREFGLPEPARRTPPLPRPGAPEDRLLHREGPTIEQLALFDHDALVDLAGTAAESALPPHCDIRTRRVAIR